MTRYLRPALATLLASTSLMAQQPNSAAATAVWQGINHATGGSGPIVLSTITSSTTFSVRGAQNAGFIWARSPGAAAAAGLPFIGGLVDLDLANGLQFIADGISFSTGTILDALANTGPASAANFAFPTCNPFFAPLQTHQCGVVDPASAFGATLTAATTLSLTCGLSQNISLTDDSSFFVAHGTFCPTTEFYNVSYTGVYVNSNGNLTFGLGDTAYTESQAAFNSGRPRIAQCWDDWNPATGGTISYAEGSTGWEVNYVNVPEFAAIANLQTVRIQYDCLTGTITITYGSMATADGLIGVTPGLSLASPVTVVPSLKNAACGGTFAGYTGLGLESINALYTTGLGTEMSGCTVTIIPGTFGGSGSGSANSYGIL